jgi:hypothetical protein
MKTRKKKPVFDRFWAKVEKTDDCWNWTACTIRNGYGLFFDGERCGPAHRFAWRITYGEIPTGMQICHSCDNPACVRPDHLFLGTHQDNMDDRNRKGRQAQGERHVSRTRPEVLMRGDTHYAKTQPERLARGEGHGRTTLTADQVRAIRATYGTGPSLAKIAKEYGVDRGTIHNIVRRRTWAHIE